MVEKSARISHVATEKSETRMVAFTLGTQAVDALETEALTAVGAAFIVKRPVAGEGVVVNGEHRFLAGGDISKKQNDSVEIAFAF